MSDFRIILIGILILFMIVATLMTIVTFGNALRLRNVKLTWRGGKLKGYPLFSSLFLAGTLVNIGAQIWQHHPVDLPVYASYIWIGLNWLFTSYLSSKKYITDYGIVKNINDTSQTISWNAISDYMKQESGTGEKYVFLYTTKDSSDKPMVNRIELEVPAKQIGSFKTLLERKLGRRFSNYSISMSGIQSIN